MSLSEPFELKCDTPEEGRVVFRSAKGSLGDVHSIVVDRDTLTLCGDRQAIVLQGVGFKCPRVTNEIILEVGFGGGILGPRPLTAVVAFPDGVCSATAEKLSRRPRQPGTSCRSRVLGHGYIRVTCTQIAASSAS